MLIHEDRLFPAEPDVRKIAKALYERVRALPIISPHGHTQAGWFAKNEPFPDPAKLFVQPDHYVYRMLYSQGVSLEDLEIGRAEMRDPRGVWRIFARHYYLFRGTPTRIWLDFCFQELFGLEERLSEKTADHYFDVISEKLKTKEFLPRALYSLRCWPLPILRSIRWRITRRYGSRDGRRGYCRRSGRTRWWTRISMDLLGISSVWAR